MVMMKYMKMMVIDNDDVESGNNTEDDDGNGINTDDTYGHNSMIRW